MRDVRVGDQGGENVRCQEVFLLSNDYRYNVRFSSCLISMKVHQKSPPWCGGDEFTTAACTRGHAGEVDYHLGPKCLHLSALYLYIFDGVMMLL